MTALRGIAMRLIGDLNNIADGHPKGGDSALLRKGDGVIDGLNKLSQLLVRIDGKGRPIAAKAANANTASAANTKPAGTALDKAELERRIAAEVDRIAAARGEDTGP
jgi:hypothetical protein